MNILQRYQPILAWLALLAWMILIFGLSSQSSTVSSQLSGGLLTKLLALLPIAGPMDGATLDRLHEGLRSLAHGLMFFGLGWLASLALSMWPPAGFLSDHLRLQARPPRQDPVLHQELLLSRGLSHKNQVRPLPALVLGLLYALGDELHQLFVPGRSAQWQDILIDATGVFLAVLLFAWRQQRRQPPG